VYSRLKYTQKTLANAITGILNAPFISLYAFAVTIAALSPPNALPIFLLTTFFATLLPMGVIYYMFKRGFLKDMYAFDRQTRFKPFLGAMLCYFLGLIALIATSAPLLVSVLMAGYMINTFVMMLITLRWKISIHASGIAGPATFLVYAFGIQFVWMFLLILPVGWARLKLNAHTLSQVVIGFSLTVALTYLLLLIYLG
jgi:membrane-associated phospholipid phosphatase